MRPEQIFIHIAVVDSSRRQNRSASSPSHRICSYRLHVIYQSGSRGKGLSFAGFKHRSMKYHFYDAREKLNVVSLTGILKRIDKGAPQLTFSWSHRMRCAGLATREVSSFQYHHQTGLPNLPKVECVGLFCMTRVQSLEASSISGNNYVATNHRARIVDLANATSKMAPNTATTPSLRLISLAGRGSRRTRPAPQLSSTLARPAGNDRILILPDVAVTRPSSVQNQNTGSTYSAVPTALPFVNPAYQAKQVINGRVTCPFRYFKGGLIISVEWAIWNYLKKVEMKLRTW